MTLVNASVTPSSRLYSSSLNLSPLKTMDQVLKARQMSSASLRRQKFEERQRQSILEKEHIQERREKFLHNGDIAEDGEEETHSADDMEVDVDRFDRESSVETSSEGGILTPDDTLSSRATFDKLGRQETSMVTPLKINIPDPEEVLQFGLDENRILVPPSPQPILQASLASWADFRYDRYSVMLDLPISDILSQDFEGDETFSPIETATPVAFQQPKSKPSLISIAGFSQPTRRRTTSASTQRPSSPALPQLPDREQPPPRRSMSSSHSGFPAAEATLFVVPDLPSNTGKFVDNSSEESLPLPNLVPSVEPLKIVGERKSSLPRLSTALSHARMSSIKNFIKPSTSTTNSRPVSRLSSHLSSPSTASVVGLDSIQTMTDSSFSNASSHRVSSIHRPPTSMSISSMSSHGNVTALPPLLTPPADDDMPEPLAFRTVNPRKKSFSALRRRSEGLGQAIKGLGKIAPREEPPLPVLKKQSGFDFSKFPSPPLPPPRAGKSSTGSSMFTERSHSSVNLGAGIGLGLRSVEELIQR